LKLPASPGNDGRSGVAPCAGAWIETRGIRRWRSNRMSPPARGRGLKHKDRQGHDKKHAVAPCAGAWIETGRARFLS